MSDILVTLGEEQIVVYLEKQAISLNVSDYTRPYRKVFTATDLVAGILTLTHNLNVSSVMVHIYNSSGKWVMVRPTLVNNNTVTIDFGSLATSMTGNWKAIIMG